MYRISKKTVLIVTLLGLPCSSASVLYWLRDKDKFLQIFVGKIEGTRHTTIWLNKNWIYSLFVALSKLVSHTTIYWLGFYWHKQKEDCGNYTDNLGKKRTNNLDFLLSVFKRVYTLLEDQMCFYPTIHHNGNSLLSLHYMWN